MTRGIMDNSVVYISIFSKLAIDECLLTTIIFQSTSIFVWVGILSSLFSMASDDDIYWGGANLCGEWKPYG